MSTTLHITTAEELLHAPELGRCELVRGDLMMMSPAGFEHGRIVSRLCYRIERFVEQHGLGVVTGAETGFHIARNPDTVRAPDVGFVRMERLPETTVSGFFDGPPDLAVEVLSPDDRPRAVAAKVEDWLTAGCLTVWVVDPAKRVVTVQRRGADPRVFDASTELDGEDALPGFRVAVAEIFSR
ncbi:MAG: Uma2 family endonuclease [Planctomycetales bacterium]|nr:Uma2 family endonuclease [Planctomycetales bacterium]